ncbi:hypothetical protein HDU91_005441 [Kappamyces sp. JEL0680]|nr:hypothetical protein HDU91_005441 [Kappamyces sp. JEL0680]
MGMLDHSSAWNKHHGVGATLLDNWVEERAVGDKIIQERSDIIALSKNGHSDLLYSPYQSTQEKCSTAAEAFQTPELPSVPLGKRQLQRQKLMVQMAKSIPSPEPEKNDYVTISSAYGQSSKPQKTVLVNEREPRSLVASQASWLFRLAQMISAVVLLLVRQVVSFQSIGCYSVVNVSDLGKNQSVSFPSGEACINTCSALGQTYSFLVPKACYCGMSLANLTSQNPNECITFCSTDGLLCGGQDRISVYSNAGTVLSASGSTTSTAVAGPTSPPGASINTTIGTGGGLNPRTIATYAAVAVGVVLVAAVSIWMYRRKRKADATPALPRLNSDRRPKTRQTYLLPGLLPETPTKIYSVFTAYSPRRDDELNVSLEDVVQVQRVHGEWAYAANLTTGIRGMVPLVCFVELELINGSVKIPPRSLSTV